MAFGIYYTFGMAVIAWLMLIENIVMNSIDNLLNDENTPFKYRFIVLVGAFFIGALIWPIMIIWDIVAFTYNKFIQKK